MTFQINFKSYLKYYNPTADISAKQLAVDSIPEKTNFVYEGLELEMEVIVRPSVIHFFLL
jgi:hypothetical protein